MDNKIKVKKCHIRHDIHTKLSGITCDDIQDSSKAVTNRVVSCPVYTKASHLSVFVSLSGELQTDMLVKRSFLDCKLVSVPMVVGVTDMLMIPLDNFEGLSTLKSSYFGVRQPMVDYLGMENPDVRIDLVIVPGLAFSPAGGRLGRGKGYYDRFLARLTDSRKGCGLSPPILMGICLDEQVLPSVPMEEHDYRMHYVVTPSHFYMCIEQ